MRGPPIPVMRKDGQRCCKPGMTSEASKSPEVSPATMAMSSAGLSVMFGPARFNG